MSEQTQEVSFSSFITSFLQGYWNKILQAPIIAVYMIMAIQINIFIQERVSERIANIIWKLIFLGWTSGSLHLVSIGQLVAYGATWLLVYHIIISVVSSLFHLNFEAQKKYFTARLILVLGYFFIIALTIPALTQRRDLLMVEVIEVLFFVGSYGIISFYYYLANKAPAKLESIGKNI